MGVETAELHTSPDYSGMTPSQIATRRGEIVGAFVYQIEASGVKLSEEKTDELLEVISGIALKPPGLKLSAEKYNSLYSEAQKETVRSLRESANHEEIENRAKFYERIEVFKPEDQLRIRIAYDLAKYSHKGIQRESGQRYFEHVRSTALIILDEVRFYDDPDLIIAALLHDAVEDATIFGSQRNKTTQEWVEEAGLRLDYIFGPHVAEMVTSVTKPKIDGVKIKSEEDVHNAYLDQLRNASPEALLVKMADRLHNLRTLHFRPKDKQLKVARETIEDYLPIFRREGMEYSGGGYASWMIFQMKFIASAYLNDQVKYLPIEWGGEVDFNSEPDDPIQSRVPRA